ncbi:MAG: helix-turn-helix domain-containing protein [Firmicutes bacterium]|nr:helix-turn-helix domain-containing protein [Bacillota bacterium]
MKVFGERLKELREQQRLSQRAMASVLGIAQPSYIRYERDGEPCLETLVKIAQFFDVSTDYLLGLDDY